ncbi:hypothetical protein [Sporosarcina koreensis]|uniref:hypothetical protein n=1 Tax=Sporosarcina koreensis TaxID=334735 RepID=UPI0011817E2C|nr:hypothetical protein [Sporosarcina koreensis]
MKKFNILCNVDPIVSFNDSIIFNCVSLYYQSEKLIAETSVCADSILKAERAGIRNVGEVINALAIEVGSNIAYSLMTIEEKENFKTYTNDDLLAELTVRVPFNLDMDIKTKRNYELANENNKVRKVLRLVNDPNFVSWVNLYRVFEIVDRDQRIVDEGWLSSTKRTNFTRTANHPNASGDLSRHGTPKSEKEVPPVNPMKLEEAEVLIRSLVEKWFEKLAG